MIRITCYDRKLMILDILIVAIIIILALSFIWAPKAKEIPVEPLALQGDYLGQRMPRDIAKIFAPGFLSTALYERDTAISPDGKELYYSLMIDNRGFIVVVGQDSHGFWSHPVLVPFSGRYSDLEPAFSPDGSKLFFVSNRPSTGQGVPKEDFDIWFVERQGAGWGVPQNPGPPLNSPHNEFYPSITKDGTIYFCCRKPEGIGGEDIFRSRLQGGNYSVPENVGTAINTEGSEFNAYIAPDEEYIIYSTSGRGPGVGRGDLWINFRLNGGSWSDTINMGKKINSPAFDYCPFVTADGKFLFFTSQRSKIPNYSNEPMGYDYISDLFKGWGNGNGDIYWVSTEVIQQLKEENGIE